LAANVRKIADSQHIHDPPSVIGGIAVKLATNRCTHDAARTIAADYVACRDRLGLPLVWGLEALERYSHAPCGTVTSLRLRLNGNDPPPIVRLQFAGRSAH